jgi:arylsulfatase A-like enzyme
MLLLSSRPIQGLAVALVLALGACAPTPSPERVLTDPTMVRRPNVIVIVADDLGYGDLGAYGGPIPTPNLDALAASGARLTQGYVTAAVCAPSRAALISGRQQNRFGFEFNPVGRDTQIGLPLDQVTVAQRMRQEGYSTGAIGKWHLGQGAGYQPLDRGFDEFFGVLAGGTDYLITLGPGDISAPVGEDRLIDRTRLPLYRGRDIVEVGGYLTDVLTDEAVAFVDRHQGSPFFLYLAYTAPHTPLQASARYAERFPASLPEHTRTYRAMMSALDDGVGRLRAKLRAEGLEDDTLIVFVSDNGCANYVRGACSNGPLSGFKAYPWEGGIRVPFLVSWPGRIAPSSFEAPASSLDIAATAVAVAGGRADPALEGVNLLPYLTGERSGRPHETLYWRMGPNYVIRDGDWKLIVVNRSDQVQDIEREVSGQPVPDGVPAEVSALGQWTLLYDLAADPGERTDLSQDRPEVVARLQAKWADWNTTNQPPAWTSRRQFHSEINGHIVQLFN